MSRVVRERASVPRDVGLVASWDKAVTAVESAAGALERPRRGWDGQGQPTFATEYDAPTLGT